MNSSTGATWEEDDCFQHISRRASWLQTLYSAPFADLLIISQKIQSLLIDFSISRSHYCRNFSLLWASMTCQSSVTPEDDRFQAVFVWSTPLHLPSYPCPATSYSTFPPMPPKPASSNPEASISSLPTVSKFLLFSIRLQILERSPFSELPRAKTSKSIQLPPNQSLSVA